MNKEEGSDKEPFSVPPSIPLLLLFISYLFLKKNYCGNIILPKQLFGDWMVAPTVTNFTQQLPELSRWRPTEGKNELF